MRLDDWQRGGHTTTWRGHTVFYRDDGTGEALLCLHGFPSASWDWHKLWPALTARYRVIAPDLLGFGLSAKPHPYPYSIGDQTDLVESLLAGLGVTTVHVLAHDYSVSIAQELLARTQAGGSLVLRSVCFLNGGLFPEMHRARLAQRALRTPLAPLLVRLMSARSFARSFAAVFGPATQPSPDELATIWALNRHHDGLRVVPSLLGYIDDRRTCRERWVGALQQARLPLRLINGPEDPVSGRHMAERYRAVVPDADVVLLDGIGHYPQLEAPDQVLAALLPFLARAGGTAPA